MAKKTTPKPIAISSPTAPMTTRFVHLAAVAWIISLGSKRGAGLPGAAKILLMAMWSYVPGDIACDDCRHLDPFGPCPS